MSNPQIFRAPMRARDRDLPAGAGARYGLEHGLVGIGTASERQVTRFCAVPEGSFVWTRDEDGFFWLGRIAGPCRDDENETGIRHVRPATWLDAPFAPDETPAGVRATFARGGRNFQRTHDAEAERMTARLWEARQ
jgi:hypothetical protein